MEYNPFSYDIHRDPYPTYKYLRDSAPLYHNPALGFWALTRFDDVWNATHDWATFSSSAGPSLESPVFVPMMIAMDPPEHNRNRGIISRAFTPNKIKALEGQIRAIVNNYLDSFMDQENFDVVEDFSAKFPMDVISSMLGIPQEDRDMVREWSNITLTRTPGEPMPPRAAIEAGMKSREYFLQCIHERQRQPTDDMMSYLVHAKAKDEDGQERGLSIDEILGFFALLTAAGNETITKFFGMAIYHLDQHPKQRAEIAANTEMIPNAVEELLRIDPPSQYQGRIALRDIDMYGTTIPKGDRVILITGAACRDEREFDSPDALDIHRKINRQLSLGHGQHLCLGANLARLEGKIALEEFHRRFPEYAVDKNNLAYVHSSNVRGFTSVPITYKKTGIAARRTLTIA